MTADNNQNNINSLEVLPPLRPTLSLVDAGIDFWQDRVWVLADEISNKYYYLGRHEYEIISRWHIGNIASLVEAVNTETILNIEKKDVDEVLKFLLMSNLLLVGRNVTEKIQKTKNSSFNKTIQYASKIFFLKIPIVNPDKFLDKTISIARPFFSKTFFYFIACLFIINIYLLASNWGALGGGIPSFTTFGSIVLIFISLVFTKIIHELGHAYGCKLYDRPVREMGITFIFFYPIFYTDVSSSILLDAKKRLVISTAGIRFEIYLAVLCGFVWFFVPGTGPIKNILFFTATVSWLVSIMINIMPFIKFDGYYILSDFLKVRNLGIRANAILKYYSRTYIFGLDAKLPENYIKKKYMFFLCFNIMTGIYKIFLFSVILLFLYYIEILGIVLFAIALGTLLLIPITRELYNIWQLRTKMRTTKNILISSMALSGIVILLFMPVRNNIYMPAVYYAKTQRVYTPFESKIDNIKIKINDKVNEGEPLVTLSNPKLTNDKIINILNLQTEQFYTSGAMLSDKARKVMAAKQSDIAYQKVIRDNLKLKSKQLEVLAPFNGKITAIRNDLYSNIWLSQRAWLFDIVDFDSYYLQAFINSDDLQQSEMNADTKMVFIPNKNYLPVCKVILKSISREPIKKIPMKPLVPLDVAESTVINSNLLLFSANYGDYINMQRDQENNWVPVDSFFQINLIPDNNCSYNNQQIIKGIIKIKGYKKSTVNRIYDTVKNAFLKLS